jgi:hypothetical protein
VLIDDRNDLLLEPNGDTGGTSRSFRSLFVLEILGIGVCWGWSAGGLVGRDFLCCFDLSWFFRIWECCCWDAAKKLL